MHFVNSNYEDFLKKVQDKPVILFGVSTAWDYYKRTFANIESVVDKVIFAVDNDPHKQGKEVQILHKNIKVEKPENICTVKNAVIVITVRLDYQEKICAQLESYKMEEELECYSLLLMLAAYNKADNSAVERYFGNHRDISIPFKIHSFWFSGEEKPDFYKRCIESWYKFCPGYEICEWNADNYDITKNQYMRQAFENRKWAFVSDYARLDMIYHQGGIYLDMDVELIAPIDKMNRANAFFCKDYEGYIDLGSGFGAVPEHPLIYEMLASYEGRSFVRADGSVDITSQPHLMYPIFLKHGYIKNHDSQIYNDVLYLSNDFFTVVEGEGKCNWKGTEMGVHWHNGGWLDAETLKYRNTENVARKRLLETYFSVV